MQPSSSSAPATYSEPPRSPELLHAAAGYAILASVDDDLAGMITTLEARMSRDDIASALGVEERELDEIASGYVPDEDVANRLRALVASGRAAGSRASRRRRSSSS